MQQIATFLMFEGRAEEALNFYTSLFEEAAVSHIDRYGANEDSVEGTVRLAKFTLKDQQFMCIDSSIQHEFTFTPAMSLFVTCESEAEIDRLFAALSQDGQIMMPLGAYPY